MQLNLKKQKETQISYLKYIICILFAVFFSFCTFPCQISTGQADKIVASTSAQQLNINDENNTAFLDEMELKQLKQLQDRGPKALPPLSKSVLASKFIRHGSEDIKQVAITFDDGPYLLTEKYIEILKAYDIRATFFLIGVQVEKYPDDAKMIIDNGYEIGIHSYNHKKLTNMSIDSIETDLIKSLETIEKIARETDIRFFRPPFGSFNDSVIETAKKHNLTTVLWCVDPQDWQKDDSEQIARHVIEKANNGAIILLHEGRQGTLEALPRIIEGLWKKGFEIVSLSELLSTAE